jgi:hypothetical protein
MSILLIIKKKVTKKMEKMKKQHYFAIILVAFMCVQIFGTIAVSFVSNNNQIQATSIDSLSTNEENSLSLTLTYLSENSVSIRADFDGETAKYSTTFLVQEYTVNEGDGQPLDFYLIYPPTANNYIDFFHLSNLEPGEYLVEVYVKVRYADSPFGPYTTVSAVVTETIIIEPSPPIITIDPYVVTDIDTNAGYWRVTVSEPETALIPEESTLIVRQDLGEGIFLDYPLAIPTIPNGWYAWEFIVPPSEPIQYLELIVYLPTLGGTYQVIATAVNTEHESVEATSPFETVEYVPSPPEVVITYVDTVTTEHPYGYWNVRVDEPQTMIQMEGSAILVDGVPSLDYEVVASDTVYYRFVELNVYVPQIPSTIEVIASNTEGEVTIATHSLGDNPLDTLGQMIEDVECWRKPSTNRQETMLNKYNELLSLIDDDDYAAAYDKLLHDIKPKLTGLKTDEAGEPYGNGEFGNPWVTCSDWQADFVEIIDTILADLRSKI